MNRRHFVVSSFSAMFGIRYGYSDCEHLVIDYTSISDPKLFRTIAYDLDSSFELHLPFVSKAWIAYHRNHQILRTIEYDCVIKEGILCVTKNPITNEPRFNHKSYRNYKLQILNGRGIPILEKINDQSWRLITS